MSKGNILSWLQVYAKFISHPETVVSAEDGAMYSYDETFNRIKQYKNGKWVAIYTVLPRVKYSVITSKQVLNELPNNKEGQKPKKGCCGG